jgi:hypothetical protein
MEAGKGREKKHVREKRNEKHVKPRGRKRKKLSES